MQTALSELPVVVAEGLMAEALTDEQHRICGCNSGFVALAGGGQLLGFPVDSLFDEALRPEVSAALRRVARGHPHHVAWPLRSARGRERYCEWHLRPRYSRGGRIIGAEISAMPVEAQRREWRRLHDAQARFQQMAAGVAAMVWVAGLDGTVRAANRSWREFVGEQAWPENWASLIHPEDAVAVLRQRAAARTHEPTIHGYRLRRHDGEWRWVEERLLLQQSEYGDLQLVGSCNDVTEQRAVRERLEEQVALTEGILQSALDAVITLDERSCIVGFNPAAEDMFGRPAAEMVGRPVTELMPARFRSGHDARLAEFLAGPARSMRFPAAPGLNGLRVDGTEFPIEVSLAAAVTPAGRHVTAFVRDMTSYARALQALQDREGRLRMVVEAANLGTVEVDVATRRMVAGEAGARIMGLGDDPRDWTVPDFLQPIHPDDHAHVQEVFAAIVRDDRPLEAEFRVRRPDGQVRWVYGRGRLYRDARGAPRRVVGVVMDVHARRQAEEQLRNLSQRLLAAQEDERRNIARELHDQVGQALTAALINLQMLPPVPETAELHATLASVLQQVRELSLNLRPSMLDSLGLEPALRWYLDRQKVLGRFEAELHCPPPSARLPTEVETLVFRLVQEAVTNILRHARARRVWVGVEATGEEAVLTVRDDGAGFDAPAVLARAAGGGSLGVLGMVERAQLAGGTLDFQSAPGQGTTVTAVLPLKR